MFPEVISLNQKNSSYFRFARFALLVIASVIVFLGVVIVSVGTGVYKRSQLNELKSEGKLFIDCMKNSYNDSSSFNSIGMRSIHYNFSRAGKMDIYVYDSEGNCLIASDYYDVDENTGKIERSDLIDEEGYEPPVLSEKMLDKIGDNDGRYLELDDEGISSSAPRMIYASRVYITVGDSNSRIKLYAVFERKPDKINSFAIRFTLLYLLIGAAAIFVTYLLLKRRAQKLIAYENDFLKVSEMFAKGDFSEKLRTDIEGTQNEIAQYVNALASNVENSEDTSKTFIANVSHELRTPMTTIGGFVDGILDGTIQKSRQNEYLVLVSNEIKRLKILISSMLNMTKFESGTMAPNFKETNITDLVVQTVLMFEKKIDEKELEVEGLDSDRLIVVVDSDLMQQVIYNLVENAIKFVNKRGTLSFTFTTDEQWNIIGIRNTGEGLTDTEIQQVFDRFYKTDSSRGKDTTGLGLGLSISRKIVHLHNGHIVVKSVYGEYTEFLIQLPRSKKDKDREKERDTERSRNGKLREQIRGYGTDEQSERSGNGWELDQYRELEQYMEKEDE